MDNNLDSKTKTEDVKLNTKANEWKPKDKKTNNENIENENNKNSDNTNSNETNNKIIYNLHATEYKPKNFIVQSNLPGDEEDDEIDDDEDINNDNNDNEIEDMIANEQFGAEDDESDDEKWYPKYKDCSCCKGYVYKCTGDVCNSLGSCFCKAQEDYDPDV